MVLNSIISAPPSEATLATSGFIVAINDFKYLFPVIFVAILGNSIGVYLLYLAGKSPYIVSKIEIITQKLRITIAWSAIKYFAEKAKKNEFSWIFFARILPAVRSIASIPAGIANVPIYKYLMLSIAGVALWVIGWVSFGYFAFEIYKIYSSSFTIISIFLLGIIIYVFGKKQAKKSIS